jgi:calcineurin-like phosphoesterase
MVAYLPYSQNNVAIPDEDSYNLLDSTTGKSYYCFLYSKEKLDLLNIMLKVESSNGTMWERIKSVLESSMVDKKNIDFDFSKNIMFKAKSGGRSVIPILIEINHY